MRVLLSIIQKAMFNVHAFFYIKCAHKPLQSSVCAHWRAQVWFVAIDVATTHGWCTYTPV